MEHIYYSEHKSQYISLVIKILTKENLNKNEIADYHILKNIIDPENIIENELTEAWMVAEQENIADKIRFTTKVIEEKYMVSYTKPQQHIKPFVIVSVFLLGLIAIGKR